MSRSIVLILLFRCPDPLVGIQHGIQSAQFDARLYLLTGVLAFEPRTGGILATNVVGRLRAFTAGDEEVAEDHLVTIIAAIKLMPPPITSASAAQ